MTPEGRVNAIADFGFTDRQARFLLTVMQHSGVCLPRQYAAFAGIVEGQKTRDFFAKLVRRGYGTAHRCRHNRAQVYHVRHKPLYRAIGEPDSRHRRPLSAARVVDGLMLLDGLLGTPGVVWLGTPEEKRDELAKLVGVSAENGLDSGPDARALMVVRTVRHSTPIGLDASGRPVFMYLVRSSELDDFRRFLQRHARLCHALPAWTLRVVAPPLLRPLVSFFQRIVEGEFARPARPIVMEHLRWYFPQRRAITLKSAAIRNEEEYYNAVAAFSAPWFRLLYRRWLAEGDSVLDPLSSPAIEAAIQHGTGRVDYVVLPHQYRHLSPLLGGPVSETEGAEEGEEALTSPRPPLA
jgi:hypothetical protein